MLQLLRPYLQDRRVEGVKVISNTDVLLLLDNRRYIRIHVDEQNKIKVTATEPSVMAAECS